MDGWTDELIDGWMDGWMDDWMDRWMDGWIDGWMDGLWPWRLNPCSLALSFGIQVKVIL